MLMCFSPLFFFLFSFSSLVEFVLMSTVVIVFIYSIKYSIHCILISSDKKCIVFWKEWYQDHWTWFSSSNSMVISQSIVIVKFLFILVTFRSGIMAFLTSIHCSPLIRANNLQRENLWTAIPAVNSSHRFNEIRKWLCFKKWL